MKIEPNPFGTDKEGHWLPNDLLGRSSAYQLAMSMGEVRCKNKQYQPVQATYTGGEPYLSGGTVKYRKRGELRFGRPDDILNERPDENPEVPLRPLYLMKRTLSKQDNSLVDYRNDEADSSEYQYQWDYDNGIEKKPFNCGFDEFEKDTVNPSGNYVEWLYRQNITQAKNPVDYDKDVQFPYTFMDMKPFILPAPEEESGEDGEDSTTGKVPSEAQFKNWYYGDDRDFSVIIEKEASESGNTAMPSRDLCMLPVTPQHWMLTFDAAAAQQHCEWALCGDLAWTEVLVKGEDVQCAEKTITLRIPAYSEYNEPLYELSVSQSGEDEGYIQYDKIWKKIPVYDEEGQAVERGILILRPKAKIGADGKPVLKTVAVEFKYREVVPPPVYTVRNEGQPRTLTETGTPNLAELRAPEDDNEEDNYGNDGNENKDGKKDAGLYEHIHEYDDSVPDSPFDTAAPSFEITDIDIHDGNPELINPFGVVNDLRDKRLRGLFYKKDTDGILFPTLFEVPSLPYGFAVPTGEVNKFYAVAKDADGIEKAPLVKHEMITLHRVPKDNPMHGKRLILADENCFTHKIEILKMPVIK